MRPPFPPTSTAIRPFAQSSALPKLTPLIAQHTVAIDIK
jgi:hypothetical protein